MMKKSKWLALMLTGLVGPGPAVAAEDSNGARPGPTWAEFQKLQGEVEKQRQLIIQLMQSEQQRYDMLLKLMQTGAAPGAAAAAAATPGAAAAAADIGDKGSKGGSPPKMAEPSARTASIEGKVTV